MHHRLTKLFASLCVASLALTPVITSAHPHENSKPAKAVASDIPKIPFEKYKLPNGLEVILVQDSRMPLATVNIWYHVGAANEEPGLTGFAHLFEHMMFAATKHVPRGTADRLLEGVGGSDSNGTTNNDRTNYFDTVPSHQLELALWIHSDRMGFLLDVLDQEALSNQQDVVRNERRQSVENRPYGLVYQGVIEAMYPKEHPYFASVIGSHADIQNAKLEDIKKFFKTYYRPSNATIAIVGDIDKAQTKKLIEKYFGGFAKGEPAPKLNVKTPVITSEKRLTVTDKIELPALAIGWHTPKAFDKGDAELRILGSVLADGKSSRLYKTLVYDKQLAQDVSANQTSQGLSSVFSLWITAAPGKTLEEIEKVVDEELAKIAAEPVKAEEIQRVLNALETGVVSGLEKSGGFSGVANTLNHYNHFTGDPGYLSRDIARLREITGSDLQSAVKTYLKKENRVVVYGVPGEKKLPPEPPAPKVTAKAGEGVESLNKAEPWRAKQPVPAKPRDIKLPTPQRTKLANGLELIFYPQPTLPLVAASLVFKGGSSVNPVEKPGLASFVSSMLEEGTKKRTSQQLADELANLGATLNVSAGAESFSVNAFSLKRNAGKTFEIMGDVALNPAFANEEIERVRKRLIGELSLARANPGFLAGQAAAQAMYGPKHPLGYAAVGTEASLKAMTRDDLVGFWNNLASPDNAALVIVGDMTQVEATQTAEKLFGAWKGQYKPSAAKPARQRSDADLVLVNIAGAPQTALRVVSDAPNVMAPTKEALQVMNAGFGGLFTSRLNDNLREQKGYSYGAYSSVSMGRDGGEFGMRTSVRTDATAPALHEVFKEMQGTVDKPIVGAEFLKARESQARALPAQFETVGATAGSFASAYALGLGLDYFSKLPGKYDAVTEAQVKSLAQEYLKRDRFTFVAAGDLAKIEPELRKMGFKKIEKRDLDGNVVKEEPAKAKDEMKTSPTMDPAKQMAK
jgi:zinc protease